MKNMYEQGFIETIVLIIIGLVLLSTFTAFDITKIIDKGIHGEYTHKVGEVVDPAWQQYVAPHWNGLLKPQLTYAWNNIALDIVWEPLYNNLQAVIQNQPTDIELLWKQWISGS